jgi:hypothetical protein
VRPGKGAWHERERAGNGDVDVLHLRCGSTLWSTAHLKIETLTLAVNADAGAERGDERIQATRKQQTARLGDALREPRLQPLPLARKRGLPIGLEQRAQPFQEGSRILARTAERGTRFARPAVLAHRQEVSELGHDCLLGKRA